MGLDETEPAHRIVSRAKNAAAFRKISRSSRNEAFSLRNRFSSASSASASNVGSACRATALRSLVTQPDKVCTWIPKLRAISAWDRPDVRTNSRASRRNSAGYFDGRPIKASSLQDNHPRIECPRNGVNRNGPPGYTPYGQPTGAVSHVRSGYRGELTSGDLVYLRNRNYDPDSGQFTTPDPLDGLNGTPTVANPYHYSDNDPLNRTDPMGLRSSDPEFGHPDPCDPYRTKHPTAVAGPNGVCRVDLNFPERPADYPNAPVVSDRLQDPWNTDFCKDSVRHPTRAVACAEAFSLGWWAEWTASQRFASDQTSNAYRHCLWASILVWKLGENGDTGARGFLNRHEGNQSAAVDGYLTDSGVDRQNNEIGYAIGRTASGWQWDAKADCKAGCLAALNDGRLLK